MKKTRLANKATDAFIAANGSLPDREWIGHKSWLAGWKRGYTQGRKEQKNSAKGKTGRCLVEPVGGKVGDHPRCAQYPDCPCGGPQ